MRVVRRSVVEQRAPVPDWWCERRWRAARGGGYDGQRRARAQKGAHELLGAKPHGLVARSFLDAVVLPPEGDAALIQMVSKRLLEIATRWVERNT